jgi:hypothetical protein
MWEAKASKPGSPDRTTDHTPMRMSTHRESGLLHPRTDCATITGSTKKVRVQMLYDPSGDRTPER